MEYNFRLNHRQAIKHSLINSDLSDHYDHHTIENINTLRLSMGLNTLYQDLSSVFDYADTGERFGFNHNFLPSTNGETFELIDPPTYEKYLPIRTKDEIAKFKQELSNYLPKPNFENWAIKWNINIESMTRFDGEMVDIAPKKAFHLKKYYDLLITRGLKYNSLASRREEINFLQGVFRAPDGGLHPSLHTTGALERNSDSQVSAQLNRNDLYSTGIKLSSNLDHSCESKSFKSCHGY
jgi:hypothetical protein